MVALTRGDEEAGLRELVWAGAVRRQTPLTVAAAGTAVGCLVLGSVVTCVLLGAGAGSTGAVVLGAGVAAVGLVFTAVGAVAGQLATTRRAASALIGTALGLAYLVRMVADTADTRDWLAWLSPLGWLERTYPYAGNRLGPLLLAVVVAVLVFGVAWRLEGQRDLGAGLLRTGRGPATARWLRTPETLAARLFADSVTGWAVGLAVGGAVVASIAGDVAQFVAEDPQTAQFMVRLGGSQDLALSYLAASYQFFGVLVVVVAVQGVLAAHREEATGRAEPVLAQPVPRPRWLGSHLLAGLLGAVLAALAAGLAGAVASAAREGPEPSGVAGAAVNMLPAALCFAGLACLLVGVAPRVATTVGFAVPVVLFGLEYFGRLAQLPEALLAVSPFHYVAAVPAEPVNVVGATALVGAGVVLAVAGLLAVRRRDIVPA
jgi:ABC-2 type transport system permease protein